MTEHKLNSDLWYSLEELHQAPQGAALKMLSGLLEDDIQRVRKAWYGLPVADRREMIQALPPLAAADFELDFSAISRLAMLDEDEQARAFAINGLIEDEDARLVPKLALTVQTDAAAMVRAAAAHTLAHFVLLGELNKIRPRSFEIACQALIEAFNKPGESLDVRSRAIEALGYSGAHHVPEMVEAAYAHDAEQMRASAVMAMGRSADKRWSAIAIKELSSPNPEMRYKATRACGELGNREAVPILVELIEDVEPRIQEVALWSLGQLGGRVAQRALDRYVDSENPALRQAAHDALEELEFFLGDLSTFFGPPSEYDGESDVDWDEDALDEEALDEDEMDEDEDDADYDGLIYDGLMDDDPDDEEEDDEW